jgi:hypothetical protein
MICRAGRRGGGAIATLVVATALLATVSATAQPEPARLLVFDFPYARVWDDALRAMQVYPLVRAAQGVIETARVERAPLPGEVGVERVAERITVRVEAVGSKITRVSVAVDAEALRGGEWRPFEVPPALMRGVLDRIRASIG